MAGAVLCTLGSRISVLGTGTGSWEPVAAQHTVLETPPNAVRTKMRAGADFLPSDRHFLRAEHWCGHPRLPQRKGLCQSTICFVKTTH
jgi:hypothetical protein